MVQLKSSYLKQLRNLALSVACGLTFAAQADENIDNLAFLTLFNNIENVKVVSENHEWADAVPLAARIMPLIRKPTGGNKRSSMSTSCAPVAAGSFQCTTTLRLKAALGEAALQDYSYEYNYTLAVGANAQGSIPNEAEEVVNTPLPANLWGTFPTVASPSEERIASATLKTLVMGAENLQINVGQPQNVALNLFLLKQLKPANPETQRVYSTMSSTSSNVTASTATVELKIQTYLYDITSGSEVAVAGGEKSIKANTSVTAYTLATDDAKKDSVTVNPVLNLVP